MAKVNIEEIPYRQTHMGTPTYLGDNICAADLERITKEGIEEKIARISDVCLRRSKNCPLAALICFDFVEEDDYGCGIVSYRTLEKLNSLMEDFGVEKTSDMKGRYVSVLRTKEMPSLLLGLSASVNIG